MLLSFGSSNPRAMASRLPQVRQAIGVFDLQLHAVMHPLARVSWQAEEQGGLYELRDGTQVSLPSDGVRLTSGPARGARSNIPRLLSPQAGLVDFVNAGTLWFNGGRAGLRGRRLRWRSAGCG
jgi:hypothetical protein